jgi:glutathione synthase/RimK-type ligase-like ATP-grasp enzyme
VKLILSNNHTERFEAFYKELRQKSSVPFDYGAYEDLLFVFYNSETPITVINCAAGKALTEYDGIYINGYLDTYELAATVAVCADALGISYVNQELHAAPSLSKLSMHAKLAAANVRTPKTIAGTKKVLLGNKDRLQGVTLPAVLKRADADRGIDNFKIRSLDEMNTLIKDHDDKTIWLLQEYVENQGYYLVSFYDSKPSFSIFRSLEARPDGNELKAHMFKPKGGANASLIELNDVPESVTKECQAAVNAMNRQIGSVDCIYDEASDKTYVLEVNYNPQLVTIETFKEVRVQAFLDNLKDI